MEAFELIAENPELAGKIKFEATAADLRAFGEYLLRRAEESRPAPKDEEVYMTPQEYAEALKISLVTLWSWDKKGITRPLRIGNAKRYRRSDLEKILSNG